MTKVTRYWRLVAVLAVISIAGQSAFADWRLFGGKGERVVHGYQDVPDGNPGYAQPI